VALIASLGLAVTVATVLFARPADPEPCVVHAIGLLGTTDDPDFGPRSYAARELMRRVEAVNIETGVDDATGAATRRVTWSDGNNELITEVVQQPDGSWFGGPRCP
jgi:hypothetical protein